MKIAQVSIVISAPLAAVTHSCIGFSCVDMARLEYNSIAGLLERRAAKANDLPKIVEIAGIERVTVPLDSIVAVEFIDFAYSEAQLVGVRDEFPHLFP